MTNKQIVNEYLQSVLSSASELQTELERDKPNWGEIASIADTLSYDAGKILEVADRVDEKILHEQQKQEKP